MHLGRLAQKHVHRHVDWRFASFIHQLQLALLSGHANHGKWAAFAIAQCLELRQRFWGDGQYVTFLALVTPNFFRRHAAFFKFDGPQIETGAPPRVVGQFRKSIAQTTCTHVVDRQNGVGAALHPALVDDFLRPALNLGVAALYRIKVQMRRIGTGCHGTGCAAAHADAHAGAAQLDQQASCGEFNLVRLGGVDHAQTTGNHDGLVVTALHRVHIALHRLLVLTKVTQQVGAAELVVESRAAQGAIDHDLQRAGNVLWLAKVAAPQLGDGKPGQTGLGFGATTCSPLVPDFTARTGGRAREGRDGSRVVVGFHLHQNMLGGALFFIASCAYCTCARGRFGHQSLDLCTFHHRCIVRIGHQHVLGV